MCEIRRFVPFSSALKQEFKEQRGRPALNIEDWLSRLETSLKLKIDPFQAYHHGQKHYRPDIFVWRIN